MKNGFPDVAQKSYDALRKHIKSGDILLCSGTSLFSSMIQQATQSIWSHVGFILRLDVIDRIFILESVESIGVRAVPLRSYAEDYNGSGKSYPGQILIARHHDFKQENIIKLSRFATDLLGHAYNKEAILRIAARITMKLTGFSNQANLKPQSETLRQQEFICSEYAYVCFKSVGIEIDHNPLGFITPADFANCQKIEAINFIKMQDHTGFIPSNTSTAHILT